MSNAMQTLKKAPFSLATWTALSMNLSARDKFIKIIQYVARILHWYYESINSEERSLTILQKIKEITSLSRRSFRMFRSINHINRIYKSVNELVNENQSARLDDVLISSVGIFEDFLLVLYFGYENYLFFVSTNVLRIRSESEASIRNSSSLVSFVGNFVRVLGVCLRINRTTYLSRIARRKLDYYSERVRIHMKVSEERRLKAAIKAASNREFECDEEGVIINRERRISEISSLLDGFEHVHDLLEENDGEVEENDEKDSYNSSDRNRGSLEYRDVDVTLGWQRVGSKALIEGVDDSDGEREKEKHQNSETNEIKICCDTTEDMNRSNHGLDCDDSSKSNGRDTSSEGDQSCLSPVSVSMKIEKTVRLKPEFDLELDLLTRLMEEESTRLKQDLCNIEGEKRTLYYDAIVVTLELLISCNYRPYCFWERLFGSKIINEGHEGVVGLISSLYVLNNIWPVVQKT